MDTKNDAFEQEMEAGLANPAEAERASDGALAVTEQNADCCFDPVLFAMKDRHHHFSIGLLTILECLKFAEDEGHVPPLPPQWWIDIDVRYNLNL